MLRGPHCGQVPVMREALTDDERDLGHLAVKREAALAELPIAYLALLALRTAGLQGPSLGHGGIVLMVDQRVNVVVNPRERMLQCSVRLSQPFLSR